jgi:hypothetical protein
MPTTLALSTAITNGNVFKEFLTGAMIDAYSDNDYVKADQYGRDAVTIMGMIRVLNFWTNNGTDTGLDETDIQGVMSKIEEYQYALYLNIRDYVIQVGGEGDALGGGDIPKYTSILPNWYTATLPVTSDGQTAFTLPFNVSELYDIDSVSLILNDADPILDSDYTLLTNQLTWTGLYPLSDGWNFVIKYQI